jgi:BirA family transcriptional regulator, biotin operon repressor / biotin---[acetyl-CoA-carboxylase] ligase
MFEILRHDVLDSTSSEAARRVRAGTARHGEVHVAREQTVGRGRQGRVWHSEPDAGLYTTVVWFTDTRPSGAAVTMAAGLATLAAVRASGVQGARLDWPNDVDVGGAKLAGVLVEALESAGRTALLVGIGVNVAQREFPSALAAERRVTSLALAGACGANLVESTLAHLLAALSFELDRACSAAEDREARAALASDYANATGLVGLRVCARRATPSGETETRGRLLALDLERGLVVEGAATPFALEHVRALDRCD